MNEQFAKEFVSKLNGKIGVEEMKIVLNELYIFSEGYDIDKKSTELAVVDTYIPNAYKVFMVSKQIEGISKNTLKTYNFHLRHFFESVKKPLEEINTNDIRLFLYNEKANKEISNRTIDHERLIINVFFEWCRDEGYIPTNPCKGIKRIKCEVKEREPLFPIEMELIRIACNDFRERAIIEFLYSTGCRVSEVIMLNINDVDFANGEVHILGKGNKHRISYLNAKAELFLKKYLSTRTDDNNALFVTKKNPYSRLSKTGLEYIVRTIGERSEVNRKIYPHLLRHTIATDVINRGMNVVEVQKILGHQKLDTTMIYAKISQESVKYNHKKYVY